jgi:hypothetical protein
MAEVDLRDLSPFAAVARHRNFRRAVIELRSVSRPRSRTSWMPRSTSATCATFPPDAMSINELGFLMTLEGYAQAAIASECLVSLLDDWLPNFPARSSTIRDGGSDRRALPRSQRS